MKEIILSVDSSGELTFIYTDDVDIHALGSELGASPRIIRASECEPTEDGNWNADMRRSGGPSSIGIFDTKAQAVAAEIRYIEENVL